jgi:hypothetical protein
MILPIPTSPEQYTVVVELNTFKFHIVVLTLGLMLLMVVLRHRLPAYQIVRVKIVEPMVVAGAVDPVISHFHVMLLSSAHVLQIVLEKFAAAMAVAEVVVHALAHVVRMAKRVLCVPPSAQLDAQIVIWHQSSVC